MKKSLKINDVRKINFEISLSAIKNPSALDYQKLWADAFKNCAQGISISIPSTGTVLTCNATFARRQGRTIEEISGMPILSMYDPADHPLVTAALQVADSTGSSHFETHMQRKDGSIYPVEIDAVSIHNESGNLLYRVVTQQDMTRQKQDEEKILRLNHLYAALGQINQSIVRVHDRDALFKEICQDAIADGKFRMAWIGLIDTATGLINPVVFAGEDSGYLENIKISINGDPSSQGPTGRAICEGQTTICQNIATDPRMIPWREWALKCGYRSSAAVPIQQKNHVIGAFTVYASKVSDFDLDDETLLTDIGQDISYALDAIETEKEHQKAEEEIQKQTEDLRLINALNEAVNCGADIEGLTELFVRETRKIFSCKDAAVYLFNANQTYLEMRSSTIIFSPELTRKIEGIIGRSIPKVQIPYQKDGFFKRMPIDSGGLIINDPEVIQEWMMEFTNTPSLAPFLRTMVKKNISQIFKLLNIRSTMIIPLVSSGKTIGYLDMSSEKDFTEEDLKRVQNFSQQVTAVIQRKQSDERMQLQLKRINALNEIVRAINASMDIHLALNTLVKKMRQQLNADAAVILLWRDYSQNLELAADDGFISNFNRKVTVKLGHGLSGTIGLERKMLHIPNLTDVKDQYEEYRDWAKREEFVEFIGIPLISKGMLKGVLEIFNRSAIEPDADWIDYLETVGNQAAIAIDNSQLFEDIQHSNMDLLTAYDATIIGWSQAMDLRDKEAVGHTQRVTELALQLAEKVGIDHQEQIHIRRGALLHDIGKLGIPDSILFKPDPLSEEDLKILHQHPQFAWNMLSKIEYLHDALDIPYCHHEKWDGTGYPRGLKGEEIPLSARLFAIVEVWDILQHDRPYRQAWEKEKVIAYIHDQTGKQFDPKLVDIFLKEFVK